MSQKTGVAPVAGERGPCLADLHGRLLEEARALLVALLAPGARQQVVGHVADQHVRPLAARPAHQDYVVARLLHRFGRDL